MQILAVADLVEPQVVRQLVQVRDAHGDGGGGAGRGGGEGDGTEAAVFGLDAAAGLVIRRVINNRFRILVLKR